MFDTSVSQYRATARRAWGVIDETGHFFTITTMHRTIELLVFDGGSIVARYSQPTPANRTMLLGLWLPAFLRIADLQSSHYQSDAPFKGTIAKSNEAIFSRLRNDELSLLISEGSEPALDRGQPGVAAFFVQRGLAPGASFEALNIWIKTYKKSVVQVEPIDPFGSLFRDPNYQSKSISERNIQVSLNEDHFSTSMAGKISMPGYMNLAVDVVLRVLDLRFPDLVRVTVKYQDAFEHSFNINKSQLDQGRFKRMATADATVEPEAGGVSIVPFTWHWQIPVHLRREDVHLFLENAAVLEQSN